MTTPETYRTRTATDRVDDLTNGARWYAWGRQDCDPRVRDADVWEFAAIYGAAARDYYVTNVATFLPSIRDAWDEFVAEHVTGQRGRI